MLAQKILRVQKQFLQAGRATPASLSSVFLEVPEAIAKICVHH